MVINPIPQTDVLKQLWIGKATVYEYQDVTDPDTHQTTSKLVAVVTEEPCRLSYSSEQTTNINTGIPTIVQVTKLFIGRNVEIKVGSKIEITQHGVTNKYKRSGEPSVFTNHQEIVVTLDKDV